MAPEIIAVDIRDGGNNSTAHYFNNVNDTIRITFSEPMNTSKQPLITVEALDHLFYIQDFDTNKNFVSKTVEIKFENPTTLLVVIKEAPLLVDQTMGIYQGDVLTIENLDAVKTILEDMAGNSLSGIKNGSVTVFPF